MEGAAVGPYGLVVLGLGLIVLGAIWLLTKGAAFEMEVANNAMRIKWRRRHR